MSLTTRAYQNGQSTAAGFGIDQIPHYVGEVESAVWIDLWDYILRVADSSDALRDLANTIMKKISSWAAIIAIPTLVTGYFGMNVTYPSFGQSIGVVVSAVLVVGAYVGLYALFRKVDWL